MTTPTHICAVTVNHNCSQFVELMLRTLFLTNDLTRLSFEITVLDNQSDDTHHAALTIYLAEQQVPRVQTSFDTSILAAKHGVALANFVRSQAACSYFLFLDADMWFIEPATITTMLTELQDAPDHTFGVQARILGYYADRVIEGRDGQAGASDADLRPRSIVTIDDQRYTCLLYTSRCV